MMLYKYKKTITVDASGDADVDFGSINGELMSIQYTKASSGAYADGVDFVCTNKRSGEIIWAEDDVNASKIVYPHHATTRPDGTPNDHGASQTALYDHFCLVNDSLNIVVSNGGNATSGEFTLVYKGD